jgi:hypothetical protein
VTPPPHSPSREAFPLLGDIFRRQAGIAVDARRLKRHRVETEPLTGLPLQPHLTLVSSDVWGRLLFLC